MKHYNSSIHERANRILNPKGEMLSDEVEGPVAVIPLTPIARYVKNVQTTGTSTATALTAASDKDTYLTFVQLSWIKDATCDVASGQYFVQVTIEGVNVRLIEQAVLTLTAQADQICLQLEHPLKIDRGSSVLIGANSFTAGNQIKTLTVGFFTEEVTK